MYNFSYGNFSLTHGNPINLELKSYDNPQVGISINISHEELHFLKYIITVFLDKIKSSEFASTNFPNKTYTLSTSPETTVTLAFKDKILWFFCNQIYSFLDVKQCIVVHSLLTSYLQVYPLISSKNHSCNCKSENVTIHEVPHDTLQDPKPQQENKNPNIIQIIKSDIKPLEEFVQSCITLQTPLDDESAKKLIDLLNEYTTFKIDSNTTGLKGVLQTIVEETKKVLNDENYLMSLINTFAAKPPLQEFVKLINSATTKSEKIRKIILTKFINDLHEVFEFSSSDFF